MFTLIFVEIGWLVLDMGGWCLYIVLACKDCSSGNQGVSH